MVGAGLLVSAGVTLVSAVGAGVASVSVPLPEKVTWLIAFVIYLVYGLANSLYEWGGYWIILLPALYWLKAVVQTTAALALAVSVYSQANGAAISPHWYSLPTGASSLALITQYFPTAYIQIAYLSAVLLYCLYASNQKTFKGNKLMVAPVAVLIVGSVVFDVLKLDPLPSVLHANNLSDIVAAVGLAITISLLNPTWQQKLKIK